MEDVAELQKTKIKGKGHLQASLLSPADWAAPQRSGWISKEGANRKSVKKRWFVLQGTKMIYFKSNDVRLLHWRLETLQRGQRTPTLPHPRAVAKCHGIVL